MKRDAGEGARGRRGPTGGAWRSEFRAGAAMGAPFSGAQSDASDGNHTERTVKGDAGQRQPL